MLKLHKMQNSTVLSLLMLYGDFISIVLCQHLFYLVLYGLSTALLIVCASMPIGFDLISIIPLSSAVWYYCHSFLASPLLSCKGHLNRPIIP